MREWLGGWLAGIEERAERMLDSDVTGAVLAIMALLLMVAVVIAQM